MSTTTDPQLSGVSAAPALIMPAPVASLRNATHFAGKRSRWENEREMEPRRISRADTQGESGSFINLFLGVPPRPLRLGCWLRSSRK